MIALRRLRAGKEDPARITERFGIPSRKRPAGQLIWIHSASVGEALSILSLVRVLRESRPNVSILLTTGTVTSAQVISPHIEDGVLHQFVPYDLRSWVQKFLNYWRPAVAILVESELWPTLITETKKMHIPLLLINGRVSLRSLNRWRKYPRIAKALFTRIDYITVQTQETLTQLLKLGYPADQIEATETLKQSADPLPFDQDELTALKQTTSGKVIWVAASTHPEEEEVVLDVFRSTAKKIKGLFLIVVPRHPERGPSIIRMVNDFGFEAKSRSAERLPTSDDQVYVADTLGEMGLWYRLGHFAFVGGSLANIGGHNPYEPAMLGCPIIHGPHIYNFAKAYQTLLKRGGSIPVTSALELETAVQKAVSVEFQERIAKNAKNIVRAGENSVQKTAEIIAKFLP